MNQRPDLPQPDGSAPLPGSAATPAVEDAVLVNEGAAASSPTAPDATANAAPSARLSGAARLGLALGWALASLALGAAGWMWRSHTQLRMHMAQDLARLEAQASDLKQQLQQATQHSAQHSEQAALLEQKVAAIDTQRQQTEALLHTLAQSQNMALLAEVRASLQTAQQQAQFTAQVQPLVQALTAAEQRLAAQPRQAQQPPQQARLAAVRQAVAQDLAHVRAARVMDVAQLLAELDALLPGIKTLPLQSQSVPLLETPASAPKPAPKRPVAVHEPQSRWLRLWQSVSESLGQLVRVRTLPSTSAALMAPEQIPYVREHLRQRLLGARMALLLRQLEAAQRDLDASSSLLEQYFDGQSPAVQAAQKTLQQLQLQAREGELPAITQSLQALAEAEAALLPAMPPGDAASAATATASATATAAHATASAAAGAPVSAAASAPVPASAVTPAGPAANTPAPPASATPLPLAAAATARHTLLPAASAPSILAARR
ncbi:MAG: uroporphyrinogen-III C-methyltransferase [Brachymonas sp.]|nr:uroporphyrinogen-III C-methyltransferase [Brachymonas sp.]